MSILHDEVIEGNLRSALKSGCHFVMTTHLRSRTGERDADGAHEKVLQQMKDAITVNDNCGSRHWKLKHVAPIKKIN